MHNLGWSWMGHEARGAKSKMDFIHELGVYTSPTFAGSNQR